MKYILSKEILEKFPSTVLAILPLRGIDNSQDKPKILELLRKTEEETKPRIPNRILNKKTRTLLKKKKELMHIAFA